MGTSSTLAAVAGCFEDTADAPVLRIIEPAIAGACDVPRRAVRSVFDLAAAPSSAGRISIASARPVAAAHAFASTFYASTRSDGVTRCTGGQYPSDRVTAERQEREAARRARQRPPKPTAAAKGKRSRKLRDLIGDDLWD